MKISTTPRLIVEEFPEQKSWIDKMFYVINDFFQKCLSAVNGGLEFGENIMGQEKEFDFLYVSHAASLPINVKWNLSKPPKSCTVVGAYLGSYSGSSILSNKRLVPFICQIAWEYTQDGSLSLTDFARVISGTSLAVGSLTAPIVGQRVVIRVRGTP